VNPKKTLLNNLKRVDNLVNNHNQEYNGFPLFSWIEISTIDMCNRKCSFCPKSDDSIAPNLNNQISKKLYFKIADELKELKYTGTIMLAGYGEPMMHKNFCDIVSTFSKICNTETTINGDFLTVSKIKQLIKAGIKKIIISMYDGPEQIDKFNAMFKDANAPKDLYILRDRWYIEDKDFGLKLTNRAGTINFGKQPTVNNHTKCFYTHYSIMIDWNGDCFLCTQDWSRRIKSGNLFASKITEVWNSSILKKYRTHLEEGKRDLFPCINCNADGTLHGYTHSQQWKKYYEQ
jgi:radical SAM protein with 4Fe4S-binding SPASM domain